MNNKTMNFRNLSIKLNLKKSEEEIIDVSNIKKIIEKCIKKMCSNDYLLTILKNDEKCIFIVEFNLNSLSKRPNGVYELFSDIKDTLELEYEIKPVVQQEIKSILIEGLKNDYELVEFPKFTKT
jgi:hypothetical protein